MSTPTNLGEYTYCPLCNRQLVTDGSTDGASPPSAFRPASLIIVDGQEFGTGWLRDQPDFRDGNVDDIAPKHNDDDSMKEAHRRAAKAIRNRVNNPRTGRVDNRQHCSRVDHQLRINSCTAHVVAGMVEYMQRRAQKDHVDASRLFLYKVSRKLLGWTGDTGAYLRTTMKALVLFGAPPEKYWPYDPNAVDDEPSSFLYAYAQNYRAIQYLRLDPPGLQAGNALAHVKAAIACGFAVTIGMSVYPSCGRGPNIPFPSTREPNPLGHAVLAVGYDDDRENEGTKDKGALLVRNSWGTNWGDHGYGWLPYRYIEDGIASDFWTCLRLAWIDSDQFDA